MDKKLRSILSYKTIVCFFQEISGSKNKNKFPTSGSAKSKTVSNTDSIDLDLPSTSKEASPALSFSTGGHGTSHSRATRSESVDHKGMKLPTEQLNFFSGNPFVEKCRVFYKYWTGKKRPDLRIQPP